MTTHAPRSLAPAQRPHAARPEAIARAFRDDPLLGRAPPEALARLLPHASVHAFDGGEVLCSRGAPAEQFWLVLEGAAIVHVAAGNAITERAHAGTEVLAGLDRYVCRVTAAPGCLAVALPRGALRETLGPNRLQRDAAERAMLAALTGARVEPDDAPASPREPRRWAEVIGWICALAAPAATLIVAPRLGLARPAATFLAILAATGAMWLFDVVDEFIPGLFALLAAVALGLAPPQVALQGFGSEGFFMAMSVLGLGVLIVSSGLSYRLLLLLLWRLPRSQFAYNAGLVALGFLATPVVPVTNGRVALVKPLFLDMVDALGLRRGGRAATFLATSAFGGVTLLSAVILSSKSSNLVVLGLLPPDQRERFQFLAWLVAAAVNGAVLLALYAAAAWLVFRNRERPLLDRDRVRVQLALLGPPSRREWAAVAGVGVFMVGVLTEAVHRVDAPWVALAVLQALLLAGFIDRREFAARIDWPLLLYLGSLVGIGAIFNHVGLDRWLAGLLGPFATEMRHHFGLFVLLLAVLMQTMRLVLPMSPAIAISCTVFMPLADSAGVSPWVVGFVLLYLGEMWFFPYQCSQYLQLREAGGAARAFDERSFLAFNALVNVLRVVAICASFPYWRAMGLL